MRSIQSAEKECTDLWSWWAWSFCSRLCRALQTTPFFTNYAGTWQHRWAWLSQILSRSDLIKNVERFCQIDLDQSRCEKECNHHFNILIAGMHTPVFNLFGEVEPFAAILNAHGTHVLGGKI